jgi:hypothetical protein
MTRATPGAQHHRPQEHDAHARQHLAAHPEQEPAPRRSDRPQCVADRRAQSLLQPIRDHQMPDDVPIVHRPAIPLARDRPASIASPALASRIRSTQPPQSQAARDSHSPGNHADYKIAASRPSQSRLCIHTHVHNAQIRKEPVRGSIEVCRLLRDPLTKFLELIVHTDWISSHSDIIAHAATTRRMPYSPQSSDDRH